MSAVCKEKNRRTDEISKNPWLNLSHLLLAGSMFLALPSLASETVARSWNEQLLFAIRNDTARPTVHARNLFHVSAAMYDTWTVFDTSDAKPYLVNDGYEGPMSDAALDEAISYAAHRLINYRFASGPGGTGPGRELTILLTDIEMTTRGYDPSNTSTIGNTPAALGNRIAQAYIDFGLSDGANEANDYADPSGYTPVNPSMTFHNSGTPATDPNRWQPLHFTRQRIDQFGTVIEQDTQEFLSPYWGNVKDFALPNKQPDEVYHDVGSPPQLNGIGDAEFREAVTEVIRYSSKLDPNQGTMVDISPANSGNRSLGSYESAGHSVNPYTGQAYDPNIVNLADYGRVAAEFWADGPNSEAPPGHWNVIRNDVADKMDQLGIAKRIGGIGGVVDDLEFDIKSYFALNAAVHDAGIAAWNHKGVYDYSRPVTMIRYQGQLGQSSDPDGPSYHPDGLALDAGLIELITAETTVRGGKHEHLAGSEGKIAINAWRGPPTILEGEQIDGPGDIGGVDWILAEDWLPYQLDTFVTPPFAAYLSGHSTFSRSAAEVLAAITGDEYFPGGLGEHVINPEFGLEFEFGPTEELTLQWATYFDAADEAGESRLWGGIHVPADDLRGREIGSVIGKDAWALSQLYFDGTVPEPSSMALLGLGGLCVLRRRRM